MKPRSFRYHFAFVLAAFGLMGMQPMPAQDTPAAKRDKSSGPQVRMVCIKSLAEEEIILASKNEEGAWTEHGSTKLRDSLITPWVPAASGTMHLVRKDGDELVSLGSFQAAGADKRYIVILLPESDQKGYRTNVIDPAKVGFGKGSALVSNFSSLPATVMLGEKRTNVMPGKQVAARAAAGDDGMYRMLVGYQDKNKQLVVCYDRYLQFNPESRDLIFLFPDATTGLKVFSLSEFGPFE